MTEVYTQWRESLKPSQKKRDYKHFDTPLNLDNEKDFDRVVNVLKNINTHQFLPLVKFTKKDIRYRRDKNKVPRRTKKERPIMYASHVDAHVYSFYAKQWTKKYDYFIQQNNIGDSIIGYRKIIRQTGDEHGKNNIDFAREVFEHIKNTDTCSVIITDIDKFFETLNHKILKERVAIILGGRLSDAEYKVFQSLTSFRYILNDGNRGKKNSVYAKFISRVTRLRKGGYSLDRAVYEAGRDGTIKKNKTTVGIPQGSPLSGLLANMYMSTFDSEFVIKFPHVLYRRYSDDIIIVCHVSETENIFPFLRDSIKRYKLSLNSSKTFIATFRREGNGSLMCVEVKNGKGEAIGRKFIDYLGFEFDGRTVRIRGKTLQNAHRKADKKIKIFHARQTPKNPRKKHDASNQFRARSSGGYIKSARRTMESVGQGIESQQKKLSRVIRKKKVITKRS